MSSHNKIQKKQTGDTGTRTTTFNVLVAGVEGSLTADVKADLKTNDLAADYSKKLKSVVATSVTADGSYDITIITLILYNSNKLPNFATRKQENNLTLT